MSVVSWSRSCLFSAFRSCTINISCCMADAVAAAAEAEAEAELLESLAVPALALPLELDAEALPRAARGLEKLLSPAVAAELLLLLLLLG